MRQLASGGNSNRIIAAQTVNREGLHIGVQPPPLNAYPFRIEYSGTAVGMQQQTGPSQRNSMGAIAYHAITDINLATMCGGLHNSV